MEQAEKLIVDLSLRIFTELTKEVKTSQVCVLILGAALGRMALTSAGGDADMQGLIADANTIAKSVWDNGKHARVRVQ